MKKILLALLLFAIVSPLWATKEALLIANADYSHFGKLPNPIPDARQLADVLRQIGFNVNLVENASREGMLDALGNFEERLKTSHGIAFFHYGGHGVQVNGKNFLIPADADIPDEKRVATRAVELDEVMAALDSSSPAVNVVVIDACRDNPLPATSTRSASRGLSVVASKPKNSLIVFAAEAGSKAEDGLFTPALSVALAEPGVSLTQVMMKVRREVAAKSGGAQTPGEYSQLFNDVFLYGEPTGGAISGLPPEGFSNGTGNNSVLKSSKLLPFEEALAGAKAGDSYCQAVVSIYFALGYKTEKNELRSKEYAMKSAKQLNPLGIYQLGIMRHEGVAMEQQRDQAMELFKKALPQLKKLDDDPYALAAVARIIELQGGNSEEAEKLYRQAAGLGYGPAQLRLAKSFAGKDPSLEQAYRQMASEQGLSE